MNFTERKTTRKGTFAEMIVDRHMVKRNLIPYRPSLDDVAHPFDRLFADLDKRTIVVGDTKAKAERKFYPDTGIDFRHYLIYKYIFLRHDLDTYLAFVDEIAGKIYGQMLSKLDAVRTVRGRDGRLLNYPRTEIGSNMREIRYFPICIMEPIADLTDNEVQTLKGLSTRNPLYDDDQARLPI